MNKQPKELLQALNEAYNQCINVLNNKLDINEIDPEKMKVSLEAYDKAAEYATNILHKIEHLEEYYS